MTKKKNTTIISKDTTIKPRTRKRKPKIDSSITALDSTTSITPITPASDEISVKNRKNKGNKKSGNWVITNLSKHINTLISTAITEKRELVKRNKYKENKNKKLRYKFNPNGKITKTKASDTGKEIITVTYV